jgi:hypothetical protein
MSTVITTSKPKKLGRPEKFDAKTRRRLIAAIGVGLPVCHAVAACRVSKSGFHDYKNTHPRFAEQIARATAKAIEKHLKIIIRAAENGKPENSRWYLERVHPEFFGRTKLELTGPNGESLPGAQVAVLVWPHMQANPTSPTPLSQNENNFTIASPKPS